MYTYGTQTQRVYIGEKLPGGQTGKGACAHKPVSTVSVNFVPPYVSTPICYLRYYNRFNPRNKTGLKFSSHFGLSSPCETEARTKMSNTEILDKT